MVSFHATAVLGVSTVTSTSAEPSAATVFSHFTLEAVSFRFSAPVTVSWPKTLADEAAGAGCCDAAASDVVDGVALATGAEFVVPGAEFVVAGAEFVVPGAEFVVPGEDFLAEAQDVSASTATTPTPDNAAVRSRTVDFIDAAVATISPIVWGHVAPCPRPTSREFGANYRSDAAHLLGQPRRRGTDADLRRHERPREHLDYLG
jgi:hypothetical protein